MTEIAWAHPWSRVIACFYLWGFDLLVGLRKSCVFFCLFFFLYLSPLMRSASLMYFASRCISSLERYYPSERLPASFKTRFLDGPLFDCCLNWYSLDICWLRHQSAKRCIVSKESHPVRVICLTMSFRRFAARWREQRRTEWIRFFSKTAYFCACSVFGTFWLLQSSGENSYALGCATHKLSSTLSGIYISMRWLERCAQIFYKTSVQIPWARFFSFFQQSRQWKDNGSMQVPGLFFSRESLDELPIAFAPSVFFFIFFEKHYPYGNFVALCTIFFKFHA